MIRFRYHYFSFITVLASISVSITVIVNGFVLFQLTNISVNWNRCLVNNDGHEDKRAGVQYQRTPARREQASRALAAGIADKPWYVADNHRTAGILMSTAFYVFTNFEMVSGRSKTLRKVF